jgi:hypothetical protein
MISPTSIKYATIGVYASVVFLTSKTGTCPSRAPSKGGTTRIRSHAEMHNSSLRRDMIHAQKVCTRRSYQLGGSPDGVGTSTPEERNGGKRDSIKPDTNWDTPSGHQRQKKPHCVVKVDTAAKEKKDLGMYYLRNASINPVDIFPKDIPEKLCVNFTCKGNECNNTNCDFTHPRKASELKRDTIIAITNPFVKKYVGWFNKYHFMRMPTITDGVKKLLGNTKGPTSKTA